MKRLICNIWTLLLFATILTGCSESDDTFYNKGAVRVDLAFTLSGPAANKTRMSDDVVQTNSARTYNILHIIPMIGNNIDPQSFTNQEIVHKTTPKADFYHYGNCDMSAGVNKCIVYAKADALSVPSGVSSEAHNGSLTVLYDDHTLDPLVYPDNFPTINAETDISKISFSPVSMLSSTIAEKEAQALAKYLTDIANAETANHDKWCESEDRVLKRLYKTFINSGIDIPGSAASVKTWANQLKTTLSAQNFELNTVASDLKNEIISRCEATTVTIKIDETNDVTYTLSDITYPRDKHLPDGAAVIRWNDTNKRFEPQTQTTTLDNVSTITRYVYPPELYYFVESDIRCKATQVDYQSLYGTYDKWADFIEAAYPEDDTEDEVTGTTHSVALTSPVQYAVAHLQVNVQAGAADLTDAAGSNIPVGTANFPLTGVIVGGQRAVDYKFDPITTDEIKFVFDSEVNSYSNNAYTHYLSTSTPETANTLVLQSKDQEDVKIILEFENKSGAQFYGVNDGVVYPDTRFYLVGTIPKPTYDEATGDYTNRVFTKAYTTVVNLTVSSLTKAYNVLPNILSSDLEVGVEVMTKWIAAKPTTVVLL